MRPLVLTITLLMAAILAGCISGDEPAPDVPEDTWEAFRSEVTAERVAAATEDLSHVIDPDHDGNHALHAVPELHEGSYGMALVGYNPLTRVSDGGDPLGHDSGYGAVDVWHHLVCVTHFAGSGGGLGGVTIVDITDPTDPIVLSSMISASANSDCQFTDDGTHLILATYKTVPADTGILNTPNGVVTNGLAVYNVEDPSNPRFLFHDNQGAGQDGYHNVFTAAVNGTDYIFQTYTGNILKINEDVTGLEIVSTIPHSSHDLWVGQHPITGEWVIVTGTASDGTAVFNFDDPENPELLSTWDGSRETKYTGWHRQWPVENTVDGEAYMVVAGEECSNGDSLPYQVLKWTEPETLNMTGSWWIPGQPHNRYPGVNEPGAHLCEMNSHEFEVWDGYVATGNYHAGIWLIDVGSPERATEPATIGYYLPSEDPKDYGGTLNVPFVWSPNVWGAYFDARGYIISAEWWSGLYILEFAGTVGEWPDMDAGGHDHEDSVDHEHRQAHPHFH